MRRKTSSSSAGAAAAVVATSRPKQSQEHNANNNIRRRRLLSSGGSLASIIKLDLSPSSSVSSGIRRKEFQTLQEIYFQARQPGASTKIVVISGSSGTGKTHLCHQLKEDILLTKRENNNTNNNNNTAAATAEAVVAEAGGGDSISHSLSDHQQQQQQEEEEQQQQLCLFGEGKFDQYQHLSAPFAAIIRAFTDLCEQLLQLSQQQQQQHVKPKNSYYYQATQETTPPATKKSVSISEKPNSLSKHIQRDIKSALEGDANIKTLIQLIPALSHVLQSGPDYQKKTNKKNDDIGDSPDNKNDNKKLHGQGPPIDEDEEEVVLHSEFNTTRIMSLFRSLLKGICRPTRPVVLFLDDLQWADFASRQLIHTILADEDISNFVFVGATRDTINKSPPLPTATTITTSLESNKPNMDINNDLTTTTSTTTSPTTSTGFSLSENTTATIIQQSTFIPESKAHSMVQISLNNLDLEQVNQMLCSILRPQDLDKTNELSQVVMSKTAGNALFVIQFLELLSREKLIYFAIDKGEWCWDIHAITARTNVSENVAEFLVSHVHEHIPQDVKFVLAMAACLGYSFDSNHLVSIIIQEGELDCLGMDGTTTKDNKVEEEKQPIKHQVDDSLEKDAKIKIEQTPNDVRKRLDDCLIYALEEKFIELVSPGVYKFSHDQVQQCFYGIMAARRDIQLLHLCIGRIIRKSQDQDQSTIFLAVDQMNRGAALVDRGEERLDLVALNMAACLKARVLSAFLPAAQYLKNARRLVAEGDWLEEYELLLELFLLSAETEYSCGNHQEVMDMVDEALKHAKDLKDKARAFYVRVGSLGTQSRYIEATKEACRVLRLLGERIPTKPGPFRVAYELIKTRKLVGRKDPDRFRNLPIMHGWKNCMIMKFMVLANLFSTLSQQKNLQAVIFFRQVQHTLKYGLTGGAGNAFADYGIFLSILGKHSRAFEFGRLALAVAEDWHDDSAISAAYLVVFGYLNHFRKPLFDALDPLLAGYRVGIESDTVEFASFCLMLYLELYLVLGLPVQPYLEDIDRFLQRLDETKQKAALLLSLPSRDFARAISLLPSKRSPGDEARMNQGFDVVKPTLLTFEMYLLYLKGDIESANKTLLALNPLVDPASSRNFLWAYLYRLIGGLVCYGMYRLERKNKYWTSAKKAKSWFKCLAKEGDVNALCMLLLLHAEEATFQKSMKDTKKLFDQAIVSLSQGSFIAFAAIANERAGDAMVRFKDAFWAGHYYRKAVKLYKDWGALLKVRQLTSKEDDSDKFNDSAVQSLRGRARFDDVHGPNTSLEMSLVRSQASSNKSNAS